MCCPIPPQIKIPALRELAPQKELPDALLFLDGSRVETAADWSRRRLEIKELLLTYEYGHAPPAPQNLVVEVQREERDYLGGKAILKELKLIFGPPTCPPIHLLLVLPAPGPAPVVVAVNNRGNHATSSDPKIRITEGYVLDSKGVVKNRATEKARGAYEGRWPIEMIVERGYGLATYFTSDVDPDFSDNWQNGVHGAYKLKGAYDWGTIAAWAWGIHRAIDYLMTDDDVDQSKIAVTGHSRLGKTALLAGALDERISAVISNMSGCSGAALSRGKAADGETIKQINTRFPDWMNKTYKMFDENIELQPMDQHMLLCLSAPRPLLINSAVDDQWAAPESEFQAAKAASEIYKLLGTDGLGAEQMPPIGDLVSSTIGYHIRPGKHGMANVDWNVFLDFLDVHLK